MKAKYEVEMADMTKELEVLREKWTKSREEGARTDEELPTPWSCLPFQPRIWPRLCSNKKNLNLVKLWRYVHVNILLNNFT